MALLPWATNPGELFPAIGRRSHACENAPAWHALAYAFLPRRPARRPPNFPDTRPLACGSPTTDAGAPRCKTESSAAGLAAVGTRPRTRTGRCPHTSPSATIVRQTRCLDPKQAKSPDIGTGIHEKNSKSFGVSRV